MWCYDHQEWVRDHPEVFVALAVPLGVGAVLCAHLALRHSPSTPRWRRPAAAAVLALALCLWLLVGLGMLLAWAFTTGNGG